MNKTIKITESDAFLSLITKDALEEIRNGEGDLIEQMVIAKEFDKPCFLLFVGLSEEEIEEGRKLYKEHRVIDSLIIDGKSSLDKDPDVPNFIDKMSSWLKLQVMNPCGECDEREYEPGKYRPCKWEPGNCPYSFQK